MSDPANTGLVIEVVRLRSIRIELPGQEELREDGYGAASWSGGRRVVGSGGAEAVEVAVEDAGVAGFAEEDEGVAEGEEPGRYGDRESLEGLGVVVLD